jgi:hypothetical protein
LQVCPPVDQRYGGIAQRAILALPLQRLGELATLASQATSERSPRQVAIVPERLGQHAEGRPLSTTHENETVPPLGMRNRVSA